MFNTYSWDLHSVHTDVIFIWNWGSITRELYGINHPPIHLLAKTAWQESAIAVEAARIFTILIPGTFIHVHTGGAVGVEVNHTTAR
jgi:hypothetical protein